MTSLRDAREQAFWPLWRRWAGEPRTLLAALLDELEAIDQAAMATWRYRVGGPFGAVYEAADVTIYAPGVAGFDFKSDDQPDAAPLPDITGMPEPAPERLARTAKPPARARKPRGGTT